MDFVVDKVSEDSFYINILLGLPKQLEKYKKIGVLDTHLTRHPPALHSEISNWEHKQGVLLPEDLRNFYNSTDGFLYKWTFKFGNERTVITSKIEINHLQNVNQVYGYEPQAEPGVTAENDRFRLRLGNYSKLFELVSIDEKHKVVLVYLNTKYAPTVWLSCDEDFFFLADDFNTYLLMAVAHLGISKWQLLFTPKGVPQWTENMIRLLAPNLLQPNRMIEAEQKRKDSRLKTEYSDIPVNKLDLSIFKCLSRHSHNFTRINEKDKTIGNKSPRRIRRNERERSFINRK